MSYVIRYEERGPGFWEQGSGEKLIPSFFCASWL